MNTEGRFSYWDLMRMEIDEFRGVLTEINIIRSSQRLEQLKADNHANALAGRA